MLTMTRDQSRAIDQIAIDQYGMSGLVLMENAGRGCAELLLRLGLKGRAVLCCGHGNNGGDGFVIARHLENAGFEVQVGLFADVGRVKGDALANLKILQAAGTPLRVFSSAITELEAARFLEGADWVVDALLGTGVTGPVHGAATVVIAAINRQSRPVLAVDLPSGLDCDTGQPWGECVKATHTATMVAPKIGFAAAKGCTGTVHVIDIGIPRRLLTCLES